jgi:hypothetical protein
MIEPGLMSTGTRFVREAIAAIAKFADSSDRDTLHTLCVAVDRSDGMVRISPSPEFCALHDRALRAALVAAAAIGNRYR